MENTFKANEEFINHLLANGFVRRHVDSPKKYLVKKDVVQVRVNIHKYKSGDITFIGMDGNKLERKEEFTASEVETYIEGGQ